MQVIEPSSASTPSAKAMSVAAGIAQPRRVSGDPVHGGVDQGRRRHAAERGKPRQHPVGPGAQAPVEHLALDLQPDEQEEHRHQGVVDPVQDRQGAEIRLQGCEVGVRQRRVRHHERKRRGGHQDEAAPASLVRAFRRADTDRTGSAAARVIKDTGIRAADCSERAGLVSISG
ncbi:hypothetical protein ASG52_21595 [Methylobacterium sp. Leaf456]|nr:hypothetical protein ASG52_21595 [Methylobacterium sp. Leaf456]